MFVTLPETPWPSGRPTVASEDAEAAWTELRAAGVIDPDVPSPFDHQRHRRTWGREFTPAERAEIRRRLGMTLGEAHRGE